MANILLINVKEFYTGLPHQKKAVEFLGNLLANTPAKKRLGLTNPNDWITISDAKLEWLQRQISDETLNQFIELWRNDKPKKLIVDWYNMDSQLGKYFTVGEYLRFDKNRIPTSKEVRQNSIKIISELDKVREAWGSGIIITSGYRDPSTNRRIGGASRSQHLRGSAVDIYPVNGKGLQFERWLDARWYGFLGYGMASGRNFSHIDNRNDKGFETGGSKGGRWRY